MRLGTPKLVRCALLAGPVGWAIGALHRLAATLGLALMTTPPLRPAPSQRDDATAVSH